MKERLNHKSFYVFYPSELFGLKNSQIEENERKIDSIHRIHELRKLYNKAFSTSQDNNMLIQKCDYAISLLNTGFDDIAYFSSNSQKLYSDIVPLFAIFTAVLSLCISGLGIESNRSFVACYSIVSILGVVVMYIWTTCLRSLSSKTKEEYRKAVMCFETIRSIAEERLCLEQKKREQQDRQK